MDASLNAPQNGGGGTLKGSKACFQKVQQQNDGCRRESKQMSEADGLVPPVRPDQALLGTTLTNLA